MTDETTTSHDGGYPTIQDSWIWPERVQRLFRHESKGRVLHVCSGSSDIGDVRIDRDPENNPDIVADMFTLPVEDCTFDTVICDPPWKLIQHVGKKHTLFFELLSKVKPDGVVLWNALTLPSSNEARLERTWIRQDFEEGKASIIAKYRRFPNQTTIDQL